MANELTRAIMANLTVGVSHEPAPAEREQIRCLSPQEEALLRSLISSEGYGTDAKKPLPRTVVGRKVPQAISLSELARLQKT